MRRLLALAVVAVFLVPSAAAEFGPESDDGYPINVDGDVVYPPVDPVLAMTADPLNKPAGATVYPYYPLLVAELERLAADHPDRVKLSSVGKSVAGLDIWMLEIADFDNPDMKPLAEREVLYIDGGTHSNEYSGVYFVTELAQFLLDDYATDDLARWTVENRHVFIVPMVNPDGSNAFGRLNANVVNINRNFPVLWGAIEESPVVNNPGPSAMSEPETTAVVDLFETLQPDYVLSVHCCGNLWLHPYGVEGYEAPDLQAYTRVCDEVFADVRDDCGPIWSTIYPASGSTTDTAYDYVGAASWGYEMSGRGRVSLWGQPAIVDDVREQERESWAGVMHAFENVEKYGAHPLIKAVQATKKKLTVTIENDGYGPLTNGAVLVGDERVALPELAPGKSATVTVPGVFEAGDVPVSVAYQKRIMGAPMGLLNAPVTLLSQGGGLVATTLDGVPLAGASVADAPIPAAGWLVGTLVLVGVAALRRR